MKEGNFRYFEFGEFRVDTRRRILLKNSEMVALSPRNFELLVVMIENEGRILSHDELLDKVWEGTFVEQANLKNAISVLRKILGEHPNESFYIKTIPRRGYSFVASVKALHDENTHLDIHQTQTEVVVEEMIIEDDEDENEHFIKAVNSRTKLFLVAQKPNYFSKIIYALFALSLIVAIGFFIKSYFSANNGIRFSAENLRITKLTTEGNLVGGDASVSPNGNYLVYVIRDSEGVSIWTKQIATGISRQITQKKPGSIWGCVLSPDENFIYYIFNSNSDKSQSGLFQISSFGGNAQRIYEKTGGGLVISPDGKRLAIATVAEDLKLEIVTMNLDGSDSRQIWTNTDQTRLWDVKYSPDGTNILFAIRKQLPDKMVYYVAEIPVEGGAEKIILPEQEKQIAHAIWLPDKSSLLLSVRELNAEIRQIYQYFPNTGQWKRVTNDDASYRGFSLTKDGKTLVASQETRVSSIWTADRDSLDFKQIMPGAHYLINVSWTVDNRIAYSIVENSREKIQIMNADGSGIQNLTAGDDGIWVFPDASSDGKHIVFASLRSGQRQIWAMDSDGKNPYQLTDEQANIDNGKLLSDGKTLLYVKAINSQLWVLVKQIGDGQKINLTETHTGRWSVSPDEKLFAVEVQNPKTKKNEIIVKSLETNETLKTFDFEPSRVMRWTRDGKALTYEISKGDSSEIMLQPLNGGAPKAFFNFRSENIFDFDWSFDGKNIAIVRGKHLTDAVQLKIEAKN